MSANGSEMKFKDNLYRNILKYNTRDVIVFGAGYAGKIVMYLCKYIYELRVVECFDNDLEKQKKVYWNDIICNRPHETKDNNLILISVYNKDIVELIRKQCLQMGYTNIVLADRDDVLSALNCLSDRECVEIRYYARTENYLFIERPITFNEKIQWLKVYDHKDIYHTMVDKIAVKDYIRNKIGDKYVVPTLGVWEKFDEIDFDGLPNSFVLKCSHDSGSAEIIYDKRYIEKERIKKKYDKTLSMDYYYAGREHGYRGIPRKIIAEQKLNGSSSEDVKDYKVFCFGGIPKLIQVDYDRFHNHSRVMYSVDWTALGFSTLYPYGYDKIEKRPRKLDEMLEIATILSEGIPHVRVDFYIENDRVYFGEMTFHHGSGCEKFSDEEWNYKLGSYIVLPGKSINVGL